MKQYDINNRGCSNCRHPCGHNRDGYLFWRRAAPVADCRHAEFIRETCGVYTYAPVCQVTYKFQCARQRTAMAEVVRNYPDDEIINFLRIRNLCPMSTIDDLRRELGGDPDNVEFLIDMEMETKRGAMKTRPVLNIANLGDTKDACINCPVRGRCADDIPQDFEYQTFPDLFMKEAIRRRILNKIRR